MNDFDYVDDSGIYWIKLLVTLTWLLHTRRNKCNTQNENTQSSLRQVHPNG